MGIHFLFKFATVMVLYIILSVIQATNVDKENILIQEKDLARNPKYLCPDKNAKFPVLQPHSTDCGKFYICDNGVPHLKICQTGLHFNPKVQACDYPENSGCTIKRPREDVSGEDHGDECPSGNGKLPVMIPHKTDCGKFYICDNGIPHLKICLNGLHFNRKILACDYPENARCESSDVLSKEQPKDRVLDDLSLDCHTVQSDKTLPLPHPTDCSQFFVCLHGNSQVQTCPAGLHFNRILGICDYPEEAKCEGMGSLMSAGVPSTYCPEISKEPPVFFEHPSNCSIYYMCSNGLAYEFACPARLHFNLRKKICDYEWIARCPAGEYADKR